MMVPGSCIQNQLLTFKSLGTARELSQDSINWRVRKPIHIERYLLTRCIEHDKGVLLLLQGLPEVFTSKVHNASLFFFPCRLRWRWCFRTRKEMRLV